MCVCVCVCVCVPYQLLFLHNNVYVLCPTQLAASFSFCEHLEIQRLDSYYQKFQPSSFMWGALPPLSTQVDIDVTHIMKVTSTPPSVLKNRR